MDAGFVRLVGFRMACASSRRWRSRASQTSSRAYSCFCVAASRMPRPNSALSSNSEFDHAGPRPSVFSAVRRGRQVAAVDRGAAGGVGDQRAVAEQLRHQLDVRRFAAAGAGAGELEQRLQQLTSFTWPMDRAGAVGLRDVQEEVPVGRFGFAQRRSAATMLMACASLRSCSSPGRPPRKACSRCNLQPRPAGCTCDPSCPSSAAGADLKVAGALIEVASS